VSHASLCVECISFEADIAGAKQPCRSISLVVSPRGDDTSAI
jgi:hypothetical protein